jgi:hypothetical protein
MRFLRKVTLLLFGSVAVLLISLLVADKVFGLNKGRTFDPTQVLLALVLLAGLVLAWGGIRIHRTPAAGTAKVGDSTQA